MTKIINKILPRREKRKQESLQENQQEQNENHQGPLYYSLEFFPPKTKAGLDNLLERIERMGKRLDPLFVDVTWGAGGSTSAKTIAVASHSQKLPGIDVLMHLTTTGMTRERIASVLEQAKANGIRNILALRGDPPPGQRWWKVGDTSDGYCPRAIDLVRLIRELHGDYFGIAVAGHPEGHPSSLSQEEELRHLKTKIDAGADFIITQFFYDVDAFLQYVRLCREYDISCPIIPGIMPIQSYGTLMKMTQYCGVNVPRSILDRLETVNRNDDEAVKRVGCEIAADLCSQIYTESNGDIDGVHFYTLNLERSVTEIIQMVKTIDFIKPLPGKCEVSSKAETAISAKRPKEEVRPINWANRPKSYVMRTEDWDEFPNGRWGDSTSPAFGELSDMSHFYSITLGDESERRSMLGQEPKNPQDIYDVFASYVEGKIPLIPWCETPLQPESFLIRTQLVKLNRSGFLTINSQPAVNGKPSDDSVVGWGGAGGYVYQKEYCECFCSAFHTRTLVKNIEENYPSMNVYAVNARGEEIRSGTSVGGVTALTWGVFPNREIVQPTIFDPDVFLVWAEEAFELWSAQWLKLYKEGSESHSLIESIRDSYFLVAVIDNDYVLSSQSEDSPLWTSMLECCGSK